MLRICLKCGHRNEAAAGGDVEGCPKCGAIYSKATPLRTKAPTDRASTSFGHTRSGPRVSHARFAENLRAETHYPTFRAMVNVGHWLVLALAVLLALASLAAVRTEGPAVALGGVGVAILLGLVSRAVREGSHMVADLTDATVRMAAARED